MANQRASRLRHVLYEESCCYMHLSLLLKESVGLPVSSLTHVNFLYCLECRPKNQHNNTQSLPSSELSTVSSTSSAALPSNSPSPCLLDAFFHEYSAAVASKASKRAPREYPAADSLKGSLVGTVRINESKEEIDDGDVEQEEDALTMASTERSTIESIPLHLLFGDAVLSRLPLCDIARARFVSRAWMTNIDRALQNPGFHMHPCLHQPCLMLLNPGSEKIGTRACLSVYDVRLNTWLLKPILFPSNASFLVGASRGLFCFATGNPFIDRNVDFFVGNPLTHTWACLPRAPLPECFCCNVIRNVTFVASQGSPKGLGYKLLCTKESLVDGKALFVMYDSHKREWDIMGNNGEVPLPWPKVEHIFLEDSGLVHCFDIFMFRFQSYDLYRNKLQEDHYVQGVRHYPIAEKCHAMRVELVMGLPSVVKCAERFYRVCRMHEHGYEPWAVVGLIPLVSQSWPVEIHRLVDNTRWEMVSSMPSNLLKEAVEEGSDGTDFVIGSDRTQHIFFILRGSSKMLAYDVLCSVWKTLPGCPTGQSLSFYPYNLHAFYEPLMCIEPPDTLDNVSGISL